MEKNTRSGLGECRRCPIRDERLVEGVGTAAFEARFTRGSFESDYIGTSAIVSATPKGYTSGVTPGRPSNPDETQDFDFDPAHDHVLEFRLSEIAPVLERGGEALTSHALGPLVPMALRMRP
jgi:hypothetical protein